MRIMSDSDSSSSSEAWRAAAPLIGAVTLFVGTFVVVALAVKNKTKEREERKQKEGDYYYEGQGQESSGEENAAVDERKEGTSRLELDDKSDEQNGSRGKKWKTNEDFVDEECGDDCADDKDREAATRRAAVETTAHSSSAAPPPFRLLTISASTSTFGSTTYTLFVITSIIHAICLILTSVYQRDLTQSPANEDIQGEAKTFAIFIVLWACIAASALVLTALIPAKGRYTTPHIIFGAIFLESSLLYMTFTCMVTPFLSHYTVALLVIRIALATLGGMCMSSAGINMIRFQKSRKANGDKMDEDTWYRFVHFMAMGQIGYGALYSIFLALVSIDFING